MSWFVKKCRSDTLLDGKTVIVTGANTGIGKVTARELAKRGASVIMACRDTEKGNAAAEEIRKDKIIGEIVVQHLDLSSLSSVRKFVKNIESYKQIHILINNAGIMACPKKLSEDGYELQFATNHLGHFLLTLLLLPKIISSKPARIINVSSMVHARCKNLKLDDINYERGYGAGTAYSRSKLANVLFTKELARRLEETGVNVYALHPGVVRTELQRNMDDGYFKGARKLFMIAGLCFMIDPEEGAQTTLYCALEKTLDDQSGLYYSNCAVKKPSKLARDAELAKDLWKKSEEMVKIDFDPFESISSCQFSENYINKSQELPYFPEAFYDTIGDLHRS